MSRRTVIKQIGLGAKGVCGLEIASDRLSATHCVQVVANVAIEIATRKGFFKITPKSVTKVVTKSVTKSDCDQKCAQCCDRN